MPATAESVPGPWGSNEVKESVEPYCRITEILSTCPITRRPLDSTLVGYCKIIVAGENFDGPHMVYSKGTLPQDTQKGQTSHPPNPGAPRRAVPRARPQRAKR